MRRHKRGLTLVELLVVLAVVVILALATGPGLSDVLRKQALVSHANNIVGLIYRARAAAIGSDPVLVCVAPGDCSTHRSGTALQVVQDHNRNGRLDDPSELKDRLTLRKGMTVQWRSFRNKPWLRFNARGVSYYQNGHFLLCLDGTAIKVVVTRIGRPRVERQDPKDRLCPPG